MTHYVLDVNETLSDMTPIAEVFSAHGLPSAGAEVWFAGVLRDGFALSLQHRAPAFADLARDGLRELVGADERAEDLVEATMSALAGLDVHEDVAPGICALTAAGHTVSTLSNGSVSATQALLERAGVLGEVAHVLSVDVGSVWKPHPDAYAVAVQALGTPASGLGMIAVHPWDVDGAAAAGLHTVWLNRSGSPWPRAFTAPDVTVRALTEVAALEPTWSAGG